MANRTIENENSDMQRKNIKSRIFTIIRWLVSVSLMIYLITEIDFDEFFHGIRSADILLLGIGLSITAMSILIRSYKWKILLSFQGANLSLPYMYSLSLMSIFFNNFFVGALGGDVLRVFKTMGHARTRSGSVASIIMDRLTGAIVLCVVVIVAGFAVISIERYLIPHENIYTVIFACIGALTLLFYLNTKINENKNVLLILKNYPKALAWAEDIVRSINLYRNNFRLILASLVLSLFYQIAISISMYFFSLSVDIQLAFSHWFFIVPLVSFIIMIPVSINGIGLQEGAFFLYFQKMGIDPSSAVLVSVLPRFGMLVFSLIGGILYMLDEKAKNPQCAESAEK